MKILSITNVQLSPHKPELLKLMKSSFRKKEKVLELFNFHTLDTIVVMQFGGGCRVLNYIANPLQKDTRYYRMMYPDCILLMMQCLTNLEKRYK